MATRAASVRRSAPNIFFSGCYSLLLTVTWFFVGASSPAHWENCNAIQQTLQLTETIATPYSILSSSLRQFQRHTANSPAHWDNSNVIQQTLQLTETIPTPYSKLSSLLRQLQRHTANSPAYWDNSNAIQESLDMGAHIPRAPKINIPCI